MTDIEKSLLIKDEIKKYFSITEEQIQSKGRVRDENVYPRQLFFYLVKENTKLSLSRIAMFCDKDHSTVLHSLKTIRNYRDTELEKRIDLESLNLHIAEAIEKKQEIEKQAEVSQETESIKFYD